MIMINTLVVYLDLIFLSFSVHVHYILFGTLFHSASAFSFRTWVSRTRSLLKLKHMALALVCDRLLNLIFQLNHHCHFTGW